MVYAKYMEFKYWKTQNNYRLLIKTNALGSEFVLSIKKQHRAYFTGIPIGVILRKPVKL
jgi:hypothetical protein